jgi:hypothetical protein
VLKPYDKNRKLSPIYQLIDGAHYKDASKQLNALITSYGPHPTLLVMSLLCAARQGLDAEVEAANAKIAALVAPNQFDLQDLNLWQFAVKHRPDREFMTFLEAFDVMTSLPIVPENALTMHFTTLGRLCNYARQQQLAMKLYSLKKAPVYLMWSATTILLLIEQQQQYTRLLASRAAAGAATAPAGAKLLQLAQMMITRLYPADAALPVPVFDLTVRLLLAQAACADKDVPGARATAASRVLALLDGPAGATAVTAMGPAEAALLRARMLLLRAPSDPAAASLLRAHVEAQCRRAPDDWRWLTTHAYLALGCAASGDAHPSALCGPDGEALASAAPAGAPAADALAAVLELYSNLRSENPSCRGPLLAAAEARRLVFARDTDDTGT